MVPTGTPRPVIDQINKMFNQVTATEDAKKFLNNIASDPWMLTRTRRKPRLRRRSRTGRSTSGSPKSSLRGRFSRSKPLCSGPNFSAFGRYLPQYRRNLTSIIPSGMSDILARGSDSGGRGRDTRDDGLDGMGAMAGGRCADDIQRVGRRRRKLR